MRAVVLRSSSGLLAFALICALLGGCGGRVEGEEEVPDVMAGVAGMSAAPATSGTGKPSDGFPTITLEDCKPGFDPEKEPLRPCAWIGKGLCYEKKLDACACICPNTKTPTSCRSGFDGGPDGRVAVYCS